MTDDRMEWNRAGRHFLGLPSNENDDGNTDIATKENNATWSNSVSLPKRDPFECTCDRCLRKKDFEAWKDKNIGKQK